MSMKKQLNEYLIIDWGTSNFRVFLIGREGTLLKKKEAAMGLLQVKSGDFASTLQKILTSWLPSYQKLPIFMAGMVGSANGWFAVDYIKTPSNISKLSNSAFHFELPWGAPATIIPGVLHINNVNNAKDVMRGEEAQILGLMNKCEHNHISVILPGTHSKHVCISEGEITKLSTYMTGELFSIIRQHSILGKDLPAQKFDTDIFNLGVNEGQTDQLTRTLFQVRTHNLFNKISTSQVESYLSGLLIGNELQAVKQQSVYLIGSSNICEKYQLACKTLGISSTYYCGDECFLSGMLTLIQHIISHKK